MTERVYWIERADGEDMGDYAGYRVELDVSDSYVRSLISDELEMQREVLDDDPEGSHEIGVRIVEVREIRAVVITSETALDVWMLGAGSSSVWQLFVQVLRELRDELRPEAISARIDGWVERRQDER